MRDTRRYFAAVQLGVVRPTPRRETAAPNLNTCNSNNPLKFGIRQAFTLTKKDDKSRPLTAWVNSPRQPTHCIGLPHHPTPTPYLHGATRHPAQSVTTTQSLRVGWSGLNEAQNQTPVAPPHVTDSTEGRATPCESDPPPCAPNRQNNPRTSQSTKKRPTCQTDQVVSRILQRLVKLGICSHEIPKQVHKRYLAPLWLRRPISAALRRRKTM